MSEWVDEETVMRVTSDWSEDPESAADLLRSFLASNPRSTRIRLRLAHIYAHDYGEGPVAAEQIYREVLDEDPNNIFVLSNLALLEGPGVNVSSDESLSFLERAANLSNEAWAIENLANKLWDLGRLKEALSTFKWLERVAAQQGNRVDVQRARSRIWRIRLRGARFAPISYVIPEPR